MVKSKTTNAQMKKQARDKFDGMSVKHLQGTGETFTTSKI